MTLTKGPPSCWPLPCEGRVSIRTMDPMHLHGVPSSILSASGNGGSFQGNAPSALSHSSASCRRCLFQESAPLPLSPESLAGGKTSARARQKGARPYRLPLRIGPIRPSARGARADAKVKTEGAEANFFGDKNRQIHHDGRSGRSDTGRHWRRNRGRHPLSRTDSPPVIAVGRRQIDRATVSERRDLRSQSHRGAHLAGGSCR